MNKTNPALKSIWIKNLLSFGNETSPMELQPLNILIGPNGSGKSNLIEVIGLLQSAPKDLAKPIRIGGGIHEWLWKGGANKTSETASIEVLVNLEGSGIPIRYRLSLMKMAYGFDVLDERIESEKPPPGHDNPHLYYGYEGGSAGGGDFGGGVPGRPRRGELKPQQSVLSQLKDPIHYPELTDLGKLFESVRLYRDWQFGINATVRELGAADEPTAFLEEDNRNLPLILNTLMGNPSVKPKLLQYLKLFYEDAEDIRSEIAQGRVALFIEEKNKFTTPAVRLSDGTLRWLALLAVLLHPSPPPLVCIEEPELGLHPDMIRPLAELLRGATQRTQLIVTTHSDALVEEFTETPEVVIVCEKEGMSTALKRLDPEQLSSWLKQYTLGELWRKGEIGGNRW